MIDWYVEILEGSPENYKSDDYISKVITTAKPCMDYFCKRLTEVDEFTSEDMMRIFSEIIEELPIMRANVFNNEFVIKYNRWVDIKLTDTAKQIYREIKLEKIFK